MDVANKYGMMDDNTKVIMKMIKKMDMVYFKVQMDINILENGKTDSNMVTEPFTKEINYFRKDNGIMVNRYNEYYIHTKDFYYGLDR